MASSDRVQYMRRCCVILLGQKVLQSSFRLHSFYFRLVNFCDSYQSMEIAVTPNGSRSHSIDTPDASLFLPSPSHHISDSTHTCTHLDISKPDSEDVSYSGLKVERFAIHHGRFESEEDSSLLEAIVQSAYDGFKSVRVVAEGSESVHSFVRAMSEEFLNCPTAVHLNRVTVTCPEDSKYVCTLDAVYPAVPRFRHLAQTYVGTGTSDRSVLDASLNAACNAIGQILFTFQPEGFEIPRPPPSSPCEAKEVSPMPSTIDSPYGLERGSSLFEPVLLGERQGRPGWSIRRLFTCGGNM